MERVSEVTLQIYQEKSSRRAKKSYKFEIEDIAPLETLLTAIETNRTSTTVNHLVKSSNLFRGVKYRK